MTHERISPTARLVAYQRTLSDIPLSSEIFNELEAIVQQTHADSEIDSIDALKTSPMAAMWEARFKIINHLLNVYHADQVLEVAAGFSPRGLNLTADPSVTYVEIDLPEVIQDKRHIIDTLVAQAKIPVRPNFHLAEGNALSIDVMQATARFFADKPLAIVNEGLLPYLSHDERATLARNIHAILERFGGMWITPDIDIQLPQNIPSQFGEVAAKIESVTGIGVLKNRFESKEAAKTFFEELGFQVEERRFIEVSDQLVLPMPQESLAKKAIERGIVFVMTAS